MNSELVPPGGHRRRKENHVWLGLVVCNNDEMQYIYSWSVNTSEK